MRKDLMFTEDTIQLQPEATCRITDEACNRIS